MPAGTTVYEHYYKHDSSLGWQEEAETCQFFKVYNSGDEYKENGVLCVVIVKKIVP